MNAANDHQAQIDAIITRAQTRARELGRWDAVTAIIDLIAAELPSEHYNAAAWYLANDTFATLSAFWGVVGGRGDYAHWVMDIIDALGTWVKWDLGEGVKFGLSSFEPWTPPAKPLTLAERRAAKPGPLCGRAGHGAWTVFTDPRGPDYDPNGENAIEVCASCFDDWCDELDQVG